MCKPQTNLHFSYVLAIATFIAIHITITISTIRIFMCSYTQAVYQLAISIATCGYITTICMSACGYKTYRLCDL